MNTKLVQFKDQIKNEKQSKGLIKIKKKTGPKINNYQLTTERPITPIKKEKMDKKSKDKKITLRIIIPVIIFLGLGLIISIIFIALKYFRTIKIIEPKRNIIKISASDIDYKKAESLIGLESIESNYLLLNETLNNINDTLMICENIDIKTINTEINYRAPNFLEKYDYFLIEYETCSI